MRGARLQVGRNRYRRDVAGPRLMWENAGIPVAAAFPKEGCILYVSGMVIPKNAPNKEAAYKYINALLEPGGPTGICRTHGLSADGHQRAADRQGRPATCLPRSRTKTGDPRFRTPTKIDPEIDDWCEETSNTAERPSPRASILGPATWSMLALLIVPLVFLARDSLNQYDPNELMIEAVTPANYLRFFDRPVLLERAAHHDPGLSHRNHRVPGPRNADRLAPRPHRPAAGNPP